MTQPSENRQSGHSCKNIVSTHLNSSLSKKHKSKDTWTVHRYLGCFLNCTKQMESRLANVEILTEQEHVDFLNGNSS